MSNRASDNFNAPDADVIMQSSDGVQFHLHRKNLESHTGSFPGPELSTQGEIVHLTESAKALKIVFQYVYPKRYPASLNHLDFETLMEVAEAVEKYEVFWAMQPYEERLTTFLPEHASEIMAHAIKHANANLIGKASHFVAFALSLDLLKKLPPHLVIPFIEYRNNWRDSVFGAAIRHVEATNYDSSYCNDISKGNGRDICCMCRVCLLAWIARLGQSTSLTVLKKALKNPVLNSKYPSGDQEWCRNCKGNNCQNIPSLVGVIEQAIENIPPLMNFIQPRSAV